MHSSTARDGVSGMVFERGGPVPSLARQGAAHVHRQRGATAAAVADWALFRPDFGDVARSWRAARSYRILWRLGAASQEINALFPAGRGRSDRRGLSSIS